MHIISRKALRQFWEKYPDSETGLTRWFNLVKSANFQSFEELRAVFPSADLVNDLPQLCKPVNYISCDYYSSELQWQCLQNLCNHLTVREAIHLFIPAINDVSSRQQHNLPNLLSYT